MRQPSHEPMPLVVAVSLLVLVLWALGGMFGWALRGAPAAPRTCDQTIDVDDPWTCFTGTRACPRPCDRT